MSEVELDDVSTLEIVAAIGQRPEAPATRVTSVDRLLGLAADAWDRAAGVLRAVGAWRDLNPDDRRALAGTLQRTARSASEVAEQSRARLRTVRNEVEIAASEIVEGYKGSPEGYESRKLRRRLILDRLLAVDDQRRAEAVHDAIATVDPDVLEALLTAGPIDRRALGIEGDAQARAEHTLMHFRDPQRAEAIATGRHLAAELEGRLGSLERLARRAGQHAEDALTEAAEDPRHQARQALEASAE